MPWEPMDIDRAKAEGACVLVATVIEPGSTPDTLDLQFEAPLGRIDNVTVHYHCQNAETTAGGSLAFGNDAAVYVVVLTGKTDPAPAASDLVVVGFADGLPSYCPLQHVYVVCGTKGFVWDIRRQAYADIPGLPAGITDTTNPTLSAWLTAHPTLGTEGLWSTSALDQNADVTNWAWPGCILQNDVSCPTETPCDPGVLSCTDTTSMNCSEPSLSHRGGTHAKTFVGHQGWDNCGNAAGPIHNESNEFRPAVQSYGGNYYLPRAVNFDAGGDQGYYVTQLTYAGVGDSTDGGYSWTVVESTTVVWDSHIGQLGSILYPDLSLSETMIKTARHDLRHGKVTRTDIPAGPVAAVQIFGVRIADDYFEAAVAAADLVDPDSFSPGSQNRSGAFSDAVTSLLGLNVLLSNNLTFTIRR